MTRALVLLLALIAAPAHAQQQDPVHARFKGTYPMWSDSAHTGLPWNGVPANVRGASFYARLDNGYLWTLVQIRKWKMDQDGKPFMAQVHGGAFQASAEIMIATRDSAGNWSKNAYATWRRP